jgi:hypothetical protein
MDRHVGQPVTIVGLRNGENGRSCANHRICGVTVETGIVVRFLLTIVRRSGSSHMEYAIGAYRVDAGTTTCLVGFLPAVLVQNWRAYEDRLAQVVEVNGNSSSFGSCEAMILPKDTGVGDHVGVLPDIGTKLVEASQEHVFLGNKDAAKFFISIMKQKNKKRRYE